MTYTKVNGAHIQNKLNSLSFLHVQDAGNICLHYLTLHRFMISIVPIYELGQDTQSIKGKFPISPTSRTLSSLCTSMTTDEIVFLAVNTAELPPEVPPICLYAL